MMNLIEERIYHMVMDKMLVMNKVVAEDHSLTDEERIKLVYDIDKFNTDKFARNKVIEAMKEGVLLYFLDKLDGLKIDEVFDIEDEIFYEYGGVDAYYEYCEE